MHGDGGTISNGSRLCRMGVISNMALDMCRNPHLIIRYLLRDESRDLENKSQSWIDNIGG